MNAANPATAGQPPDQPTKAAPPQRLNLIGAGRVGLTLARLWATQPAAGLRLQAVCNPGEAARARAALHLPAGTPWHADLATLPPADVWLLAVPDGQITSVAAALAASPGWRAAPSMAWHCSGFLSAQVLAPLRLASVAAPVAVASAHPALSFANVASACAQFPGTLVALEGDATATALAHTAFSAIGGVCWPLAAEHKALYHGAAVFASNFLPVLTAVAQELWQGSGVPPEHIPALAQGFVRRVADNVQALGPAAALTGPAARGDTAVLAAQGAAMAARDPVLGQAYVALSALATRLAAEGRTLPPG